MRPLRGLQENRVATREESGVLGFPSRRGLTPQGSLECNLDAQQAPARLGFPGALPQRRAVWMWFGAFPAKGHCHPRASCGGGGAPRDSAGSGATEEGLTSRRGVPLWACLSIYPKTRVCLLYCFVLSPTPLTLQGAVPHHQDALPLATRMET